jgi:hypothetical protein
MTRPDVSAGPILRKRKPAYAACPPGSGVGEVVGEGVGVVAANEVGVAPGVGVGLALSVREGRWAHKLRVNRLRTKAASTRHTKPLKRRIRFTTDYSLSRDLTMRKAGTNYEVIAAKLPNACEVSAGKIERI